MARQRRKLTSLIMLVGTVAAGQTGTKVQQKSEKSTCSNIVALAGNVKVNCSSLNPEQKKVIERIPAILSKILANQIDPNAVMDKLDEILRASSRPVETVNAPNGIGTIGGTLINPQVNNFGPPACQIDIHGRDGNTSSSEWNWREDHKRSHLH